MKPSTQMTDTVDHHRTYGGAKNFYFATRKEEEPCTFFLMRVSISQAVKVFEGVLGGDFFQKVPPKKRILFSKVPPKNPRS